MKTLFLTLLLLCSACVVRDVPKDGGMRQQLVEFVTAAGDAAIRLEGTRLLNEHAPALVAVLDKDKDTMVSLEEIVQFIENADPTQLVMLGIIFFRD